MDRELIDPLNEDTYDDRVIVHSPIKTPPPTPAYVKGWERIFGPKWSFIIYWNFNDKKNGKYKICTSRII